MTERSNFAFVTFGEAMLRIAPSTEKDLFTKTQNPSAATNTLLTVGGDEMNVSVALSLLNIPSEWISILPNGPLGDIVMRCAKKAGVKVENVILRPFGEIGTFFVLPEEKRVHYQRNHSSWAEQEKNVFDWYHLLSKSNTWLHVTGITPMTCDNAAFNWNTAIEIASELGVPISMDFNHRKQLGPLTKLWNLTKPHLHKLHILILSIDSLQGLCKLENISHDKPEEMLKELSKKFQVRLAYCHKVRFIDDNEEVQRRYSVIADFGVLHSTLGIPVVHQPKDECGGGSAWAAGYLSYVMSNYINDGYKTNFQKALRRADLLAALCQETTGDHSTVTLSELLSKESMFEGKTADITEKINDKMTITLDKIKKSKLIAILRAKNTPLAIERAVQLANLGCKALELTLDTPNCAQAIKDIKQRIKDKDCLLGVGTVTSLIELEGLVSLDIDFAISPINPEGFIEACHKHNIIAVPGASSPQELWNCYLQGAKVIKLFPSQLWSPSALKAMLEVGPLGNMNIIATGGIQPNQVETWLKAGAKAVGLGSNLCGSDIKYNESSSQYQEEVKKWNEEGFSAAKNLIQSLNIN